MPELTGIAMANAILALHGFRDSHRTLIERLRTTELPDASFHRPTRTYSGRHRLSLWLAIAAATGSDTVVLGDPGLERPSDVTAGGLLIREANGRHSTVLLVGATHELVHAARAEPWPKLEMVSP